MPTTLIELEKIKPTETESIRQATAAEKGELGFDVEDNINVKVKGGRIIGIASKPTAGERDKAADRADALRSINAIQDGLKETRTGPVSGRLAKTRAYLGFDSDQIREIRNLPSRWVFIWKEYPKYLVHEKGVMIW